MALLVLRIVLVQACNYLLACSLFPKVVPFIPVILHKRIGFASDDREFYLPELSTNKLS